MALEPITRQEKIIAGQDLTPITRMEKFLKDFGGGGGGAQPDWNQNDSTAADYVKNRPFYYESLISVPHPDIPDSFWYKVSDAVPTGDHSLNAGCCSVIDGVKLNGIIILSTDDCYVAAEYLAVIVLNENAVVETLGKTFPEKGTYFLAGSNLPLITGFALGKYADPEITWDGNTGTVNQIDEKFLPPVSGLIVKSSTANSTKKFKITVDDTGTISATEVT